MKKKTIIGFTLIELLAVLAILAIILLIAVPRILGLLTTSKDSAYEIQINLIIDAAEIYAAKHPDDSNITIQELIDEKLLGYTPVDPRDNTLIEGEVTLVDGVLAFAEDTSNPAIPVAINKTYGGSAKDYFSFVESTNDGNYLVFGYTYSTDGDLAGEPYNTGWVMKVDENGDEIWSKTSPELRYANDAIKTNDGNYFVVGASTYTGHAGAFIIKMDDAGNILWTKTYGGSNSESFNSIIKLNDASFLLVGETSSTDGDITDGGRGSSDAWILHVNSNGDKVDCKTYGGSSADEFNAVHQNSDGSFVVTGSSYSPEADLVDGTYAKTDVLTVKLDSNYTQVWSRTFGGSWYDKGEEVLEATNGNYVVFGDTGSGTDDLVFNDKAYEVLVLEYNKADGTLVGYNTVGGSNYEVINGAVKANDGGVYVLGRNDFVADEDITDGNNGEEDALIIKFDKDGNKLWDKTYGGTSDEQFFSLYEDANGDILAVGYSESTDGDITDGNQGQFDSMLFVLPEGFEHTIPEISLSQGEVVYWLKDNPFTEPGFVAKDSLRNVATADVVSSGVVDASTLGDYILTYTLADDYGFTVTATRTVKVVNALPYFKTWDLGTVASTTHYALPYDTYYHDQRIQFILTQSDLQSLGIESGAILNALELDNIVAGDFAIDDFTIRLGETTDLTLSAFKEGLTQVYRHNIGIVSQGLQKYNFDTNYTYNGQTLIVDITRDNTDCSSPKNMEVVSGVGTGTKMRGYYDDSGGTYPYTGEASAAFADGTILKAKIYLET